MELIWLILFNEDLDSRARGSTNLGQPRELLQKFWYFIEPYPPSRRSDILRVSESVGSSLPRRPFSLVN